MYFISSLVFTTIALTTLVSSRPYGNHLVELTALLTETGALPPSPGLPPQALEELFTILSNTSQTVPQMEQKMLLLVKKHGITEQMEKYGSEISEKVSEFRNKYDSILNNLVSVEKQYQEIINNKTMTIAEISEKVEEFEKQYPLELETLQCLFDKMLDEIRLNANKGDNNVILQGIEAKEKMMKAMKFTRRK